MPSKHPTVLFVTYGGGHAQMIWPVVHALKDKCLQSNHPLQIRVLGLPAAKRILDDHQVENFGLSRYLDKQTDADAVQWGEQLVKTHHSPDSGIDIGESIAYLGLNYKDLVVRFGEDRAATLLSTMGRQAFFPLNIMQRIFDDCEPDFVVTTNSPRSEAAAIEMANLRGINNLIMTDLFTGFGNYQLKAKNISFINKFASDQFTSDGLVYSSTSDFHYTGNPAFDRLLTNPARADSKFLQNLFPLARGQNFVLHADMPAYWDFDLKCAHFKSETEIIEEMDIAYQSVVENDAVYLIRQHPSQDSGIYRRWLKNRKQAFLAADFDLHSLLRNISLLLVRSSTVGLEAAYLRQRVLQIDSDLHQDLPLEKMGIAWGVNSYDKLSSEIGSALSDDIKFEKIKARIESVLPFQPASEKIADIILQKLPNQ